MLEKFGTAMISRPLGRRRQMFEHVPDDDEVEQAVVEPGLRQARRDANFGACVTASRRVRVDFDAEDAKALVGERTEQHTASAPDVEDARAGCEAARQECDVTRCHGSNEALDDRPELRSRRAVVVLGVERADLGVREHRIESAEPAGRADDHRRFDAVDAERRDAALLATHHTR
jgi:hypothetical protein